MFYTKLIQQGPMGIQYILRYLFCLCCDKDIVAQNPDSHLLSRQPRAIKLNEKRYFAGLPQRIVITVLVYGTVSHSCSDRPNVPGFTNYLKKISLRAHKFAFKIIMRAQENISQWCLFVIRQRKKLYFMRCNAKLKSIWVIWCTTTYSKKINFFGSESQPA